MRKAYENVLKVSPDVYYPLGKITSRGRPGDIMSYRRPQDVLKTSSYGSVRPRNVHVIGTLYECYITKVLSIAQQVTIRKERIRITCLKLNNWTRIFLSSNILSNSN